MDHRIAANLTRDGINELRENGWKADQAIASLISGHYGALQGKQKLTYSGVSKVADLVCSAIASQPHNVFIERFDSAKLSRLARRFDALFLGSSFEAPDEAPSRERESLLQANLFQGRFERKRFSMNHLVVPVYLRSHAIQRYMERTSRGFDDALRETGSAILFVSSLTLTEIGGGMAVPFMVPSPSGAFFGVRIPGDLTLAETNSVTIDSQGQRLGERVNPSLNHLTKTFINTFVSNEELREDQHVLCDRLRDFIAEHREMLLHHAMEHVNDAGDFTFQGILGARTEAFLRELRTITGGNLWKAVVKPPSETIFQQYFDEQMRVDRYGIKTLLEAQGIDQDDEASLMKMGIASGVEPSVIETLLKKIR